MQNVYDIARDLVASLKECDQYKNFKNSQKKVNADENLAKMINDFTSKGMELQGAAMTGQQPDEESLKQYQQLYGVVMGDPTCAEYLNSQLALSQIVTDIYQMIGAALDE